MTSARRLALRVALDAGDVDESDPPRAPIRQPDRDRCSGCGADKGVPHGGRRGDHAESWRVCAGQPVPGYGSSSDVFDRDRRSYDRDAWFGVRRIDNRGAGDSPVESSDPGLEDIWSSRTAWCSSLFEPSPYARASRSLCSISSRELRRNRASSPRAASSPPAVIGALAGAVPARPFAPAGWSGSREVAWIGPCMVMS